MFLLNTHLVIIILILSIIYGTFMSIYQVKLMRLIGYSAIIHISFALLGVVQGNAFGLLAGLLYIIVYCFLNIGLFLIIIILKDNKLVNELHLIEIVDFLKILKSNIFLSYMVISIFFSMAGIPTLSGFFIKLYIYFSLGLSYNFLILVVLLVVGIVNSVYYIRLIRLTIFNSDVKINIDNIKILDMNIMIILFFIFILNVFFIFIHIYFLSDIFNLI
jgi:NADH-quinone oxidoreductase subunit N